jgi:uncharacterized membrane protein YjgN (DUF898 family)
MIQYGASTKMNAISSVIVIAIVIILTIGILLGNLNDFVGETE